LNRVPPEYESAPVFQAKKEGEIGSRIGYSFKQYKRDFMLINTDYFGYEGPY
jgi:hypothetical protein